MHGKTVLMVHGAGGGGWEFTLWRHVFEAAQWRVVAPDLTPGAHGIEATRFADYEAQVRAWCVASAPSLIIGASLGGLLALRIADAAPVARLVLVNPMPPQGYAGALAHSAHYPGRIDWQKRASLASTAAALPDADPITWQWSWRRWRDESGAVMNAAVAGMAVETPRAATLVVVSGEDRDIHPQTTRQLARDLGADLLELGEASHVGPLLGRDAAHTATRVLAWHALRS